MDRRQSDQHCNRFKGNAEWEVAERLGEVHMRFTERIDIHPS